MSKLIGNLNTLDGIMDLTKKVKEVFGVDGFAAYELITAWSNEYENINKTKNEIEQNEVEYDELLQPIKQEKIYITDTYKKDLEELNKEINEQVRKRFGLDCFSKEFKDSLEKQIELEKEKLDLQKDYSKQQKAEIDSKIKEYDATRFTSNPINQNHQQDTELLKEQVFKKYEEFLKRLSEVSHSMINLAKTMDEK